MKSNRKKKATLNPAIFALLVLTAISLGATGIFHTVMKNHQLKVKREIMKVENRIKDCDRDRANLDIRIGRLENWVILKQTLVNAETELREIDLPATEHILAIGTLPEVAQND